MKGIMLILGILLVGMFLISNVAQAETGVVKDNGFFGCTDKEVYEKIVNISSSGDKEAFYKAFAAGLLSGICTTFDKGQEVFIIDEWVFSGRVKLRPKGEVKEYWTTSRAVK